MSALLTIENNQFKDIERYESGGGGGEVFCLVGGLRKQFHSKNMAPICLRHKQDDRDVLFFISDEELINSFTLIMECNWCFS